MKFNDTSYKPETCINVKSGKAVYNLNRYNCFLYIDISLKVIHLFVYMKSLPFQCEHC